MWRPKNWEKNKKTLDIPQGTEPQTTLCRHCAYMVAQAEYSYEAGADAMFVEVIKLIERLGYQRVADDIKLFTMEV